MLNRSKPPCGQRRRQAPLQRQRCVGGITPGAVTSVESVGTSPAPQALIDHLAASIAGDYEFSAQVMTMLLTLVPSQRDRFSTRPSASPQGKDSRARHTASDWHPPIQVFLIADVRGYTRFTLEQGDEAAGCLASRFAHLIHLVVTPLGGRVLELRGDEALVCFASARNALRAAAHVQQRFMLATAQDPRLPLPVGIGIDAGEAVPVEGGFRGAALNLAARLCSLAGPGEIFASEAVIHLARKVDGLHYQSWGLAALKGFPEPVSVTMVQADITRAGLVAQQDLVIARRS